MKSMSEKKEKKPTITRAEKKDGAKKLIVETLKKGDKKGGELIDEVAKLYAQQFGGEENENPNDVKGRIGSLLDVMKKENEVQFDGGIYSLKAEQPAVVPSEEQPKKATKAKAKKQEKTAETTEEKPKKSKKTVKAKKTEEEIVLPVPPAPIMPIAPVAPITPEVAPEPIPQPVPEQKPKKRATKKAKATVAEKTEEKIEEKQVENSVPVVEEKQAEEVKEPVKIEEKKAEKVEESSPKGTLMDMSFLFGEVKSAPKKASAPTQQVAQPQEKKAEVKQEQKTEEKNEPKKVEMKKAERKPSAKKPAPTRTLTADERLQDAFLGRLRKLGGAYFEYYSVYLLEKYSRINGRRLESLKITAGDHDGGIDGEIELTDRLGFRETIYIQSKNWNPDKGDEKLWVVGETLLQQFIGACVCRQAKDKKQHCRGIFITTSRFTQEARKILEETSDKFVGYDGQDLFECAKECGFGIIQKNGVFVLDEELLSGEKAFFRMF